MSGPCATQFCELAGIASKARDHQFADCVRTEQNFDAGFAAERVLNAQSTGYTSEGCRAADDELIV
jgi:hypothetical protein